MIASSLSGSGPFNISKLHTCGSPVSSMGRGKHRRPKGSSAAGLHDQAAPVSRTYVQALLCAAYLQPFHSTGANTCCCLGPRVVVYRERHTPKAGDRRNGQAAHTIMQTVPYMAVGAPQEAAAGLHWALSLGAR
jgi:hypothetical protein